MTPTLARQFHGTCALVRVQLMRAAENSDVEACFPVVRSRELITEDDECFIRACFALDDALQRGDEPNNLLTKETIARLHMIVASRLNVADSA